MQHRPAHRLDLLRRLMEMPVQLVEAEQLGLIGHQRRLGVGKAEARIEARLQLEERRPSLDRVVARRQRPALTRALRHQPARPVTISPTGDQRLHRLIARPCAGQHTILQVLQDPPLDDRKGHGLGQGLARQRAQHPIQADLAGHRVRQQVVALVGGHIGPPPRGKHRRVGRQRAIRQHKMPQGLRRGARERAAKVRHQDAVQQIPQGEGRRHAICAIPQRLQRKRPEGRVQLIGDDVLPRTRLGRQICLALMHHRTQQAKKNGLEIRLLRAHQHRQHLAVQRLGASSLGSHQPPQPVPNAVLGPQEACCAASSDAGAGDSLARQAQVVQQHRVRVRTERSWPRRRKSRSQSFAGSGSGWVLVEQPACARRALDVELGTQRGAHRRGARLSARSMCRSSRSANRRTRPAPRRARTPLRGW